MDKDAGWRELRRPTRGPLESTPFARLASAHAFALAGDTLVTMALAGSLFFDISPTAARGRVLLSLVLTMAPFALVAPVLGPAIDRSRQGRKAMIVLSCAGRAVGCLLMVPVLQGLLLFPAAFVVLVLSKTYSVAKSALVPATVADAGGLVKANARLTIVGVLSGFAAAVPGVVLLRLLDSRWVLRLAAVAFLAAAVAGLRLPSRTPGAVEPVERGPARTDPLPGPLAGATGAAPASHPALRLAASAAVMALLRAMVGFSVFLVAFSFRRHDAPSWHFGLVLAASMGATLAGSVVAPRARRRVGEERILGGCLVVVAAVSLGLAGVDGRLWAAAVAASVGLAAGAGRLAFDALVQRDVGAALRGRSFARFEAGFQMVWVVGALLPVVVSTPLQRGYVVLGASAAGGLVAYLAALSRLGAGRA